MGRPGRSPGENRELAQLIPGARYEEFEGASHGLIWEATERFGDVLAEFVAGASIAGAGAGSTVERRSNA